MDKIDRLLDAMEHPEHFSQSEIEALLQDQETKEILDVIDKTKSSIQTITIPDIDDEWKKFENKHRKAKPVLGFRFARLFSNKIAASIAIGIVSLTAVAAIVGVSVSFYNRHDINTVSDDVKKEEATVSSQFTHPVTEEIIPASPETIVFDDEPFDLIISKIGVYYGYEVNFNSENAKSLRLYYRWNQALPIEEVVESLNNFGQIHLTIIDRTLNVN